MEHAKNRSDAEFALIDLADVHTNVAISMFTDFVNFTDLQSGEYQVPARGTRMDQVVNWSTALAPLREVRQAA